MLGFVAGLMCGGFLGVLTMCILIVGKRGE